MTNKNKKIIFFCPGPEYLFYNTGIYCLWELSRSYSVVLLLDFPYRNLNTLKRLKEESIIEDFIEVFFNPKTRLKLFRMIQKQRNYYRISKLLFDKYQPSAIIQHNDVYPLNMYYFEEASSRNCVRIRLNASNSPDDPDNEVQRLHVMHINNLQYKFKIPYLLAFLFHAVTHLLVYLFGYYIVPFFIKGNIFKPSINPFPINKKWFNKEIYYYEHSLAYSDREKKGLIEYCGEPATAFRNPLYDVGEDVFPLIYGQIKEKNEILILLTASEIAYIAKTKAMPHEDVIQYFFIRWSRAIDILQVKYPYYKISIKLKPGQSEDIQSQYCILAKRLIEHNRNIYIIPSEENTQKLMLEAKVIVTSYSSVLWWANHLKLSKILISLDVFDIPEGNLFSNTPGIYYFNTLEALKDFDFSNIKPRKKNLIPSLTLTEFMRRHLDA
ncbi:hypothetical protein C4588_06685 [Candidatus Parcubacteria bacterium]|nr:MAG: hypothetical protein C4588_06685 [Candidatus Parcubacteria bacterium]